MEISSTGSKQNSTPVLGCQAGCQHSSNVLIDCRATPGETPRAGATPREWQKGGLGGGGKPSLPGPSAQNSGGAVAVAGYLEPHANVSADLNSKHEIREDYVKPCPGYWLLGFCDNGHRFAMELHCGCEWCPVCGEEWSPVHQRRFSRWLSKAYQIRVMGYFVFTIPEELRAKYRTKKGLSILGHQVQELLKAYGYSRGLRRWHWFGEITRAGLRGAPVFHPHLNCLVDGGYLAPEKLDLIKAAYAGILGCQVVDVNYRYRQSPGEKVHALKYVTRATFRELDWDSDVALQIHGTRGSPGLRNQVSWGRGLWDQEPAWSLEELQDPGKEELADLDSRAVESLESGTCPRCGLPITWSKPLPIEFLEAVESSPLGGGYRELPRVRPPPGLPVAVKRRLYWLELLHRVEVRMATASADREARAKAEEYQSWWHAVIGGRYDHGHG